MILNDVLWFVAVELGNKLYFSSGQVNDEEAKSQEEEEVVASGGGGEENPESLIKSPQVS